MPRSKDKKSKRTKPVQVEDLTPRQNPKGGTLASPFIPGAAVVSAAISGTDGTKKA